MAVTMFEDLAKEIAVPANGILSRTIHRDDTANVVLFGFAPGEQLSEHTAAVPAIMHFLDGTGEVIIDGHKYSVQGGSWFCMPPHTPHTVVATTPLTMLLTLIAAAAAK